MVVDAVFGFVGRGCGQGSCAGIGGRTCRGGKVGQGHRPIVHCGGQASGRAERWQRKIAGVTNLDVSQGAAQRAEPHR